MRRNERFSVDFHQRIESLSQVLIPYILNKYKEMPVETQELNKSLAYFLKVAYNTNNSPPNVNPQFFLEMFEFNGQRICIQVNQRLHGEVQPGRPENLTRIQVYVSRNNLQPRALHMLQSPDSAYENRTQNSFPRLSSRVYAVRGILQVPFLSSVASARGQIVTK